MSSSFDVYVRRNTWLYALDPRVKLAFVLEATLFAFLWPHPAAAIAMTVVTLLLLSLAQVPGHRVFHFVRGTLPLLLMVLVLTALFGGAQEIVWLGWGPVQFGPSSLQRAFLLAARLLALALVFFLWLTTTDQAALVRGFVALGLPYSFGLTLALTLRYLPILAGLFEQVREAQAARGLDLAQGGLRARLSAYRPVLVAVVIGALRQAERLGWALESRALGATGVRRTNYRPLRFRDIDLAVLLVLLLLMVGALLLRML
jgi:energy-coupling factor transport system permease protein